MKLILKILGGLVLLVVIASGAVIYYLDNIIRETVVRVVPEVTGTNVELDSVSVSLFGGSASINGLLIGNPTDFTDPNAFTLGTVAVELDLSSLREDIILINSIYIDAPEISYESLGDSDNFRRILENVNQRIGSSDQTVEDATETADAEAKKVIIEKFVLVNGRVSVRHPLLSNPANVTLPDLELTGIGQKTNGATAQEAAGQIIKQISDATIKALTSTQLIEQARARLEQFEAEVRAKLDAKLDEVIDGKVEDRIQEKLEELGIDEGDAGALKDLLKGF